MNLTLLIVIVACFLTVSCGSFQQPNIPIPLYGELHTKSHKHPKLWHPIEPVWECNNGNCYQRLEK